MKVDIVRAWKDAAYRASLSAEEQALLPANPAGIVELSDAELEAVHGAQGVPQAPGSAPVNANNVRVDTSGVICLHTVQVTVNLRIVPALSPSNQNAVCY